MVVFMTTHMNLDELVAFISKAGPKLDWSNRYQDLAATACAAAFRSLGVDAKGGEIEIGEHLIKGQQASIRDDLEERGRALSTAATYVSAWGSVATLVSKWEVVRETPDETTFWSTLDQFRKHRVSRKPRTQGSQEMAQEPEWLVDFVLPNETKVRSEALSLEALLRPVLVRKKELADQISSERLLLRPLYETGVQLERSVYGLLHFIGMEVTPPTTPGKDAGILVTPSAVKVVLEIKGHRSPIGIQDVRQVNEWVTDKSFVDDKTQPEDWKGLLIGNPYSNISPNNRSEVFTPNAIAYAERNRIALLTTIQLIDALRSHQEGTFDADTWWATVVASDGPVVF
jgi:hypothetical protein